MKKKLLCIVLTTILILALMPASAFAAAEKDDITIVFTNDVHCNYLKYDKLATVAKDADLLVDAGDAIQGAAIGTISEGEYIIDIMNYVGYDLAVLGKWQIIYDENRSIISESNHIYINQKLTIPAA